MERNSNSNPEIDFKGKYLRTFIKNYEPFIYSVCIFIWALIYFIQDQSDWTYLSEDKYMRISNFISIFFGYSIITVIRIYAFSPGMCIWYRANIIVLALNLLDGLLNILGILSNELYSYFSIALGGIGIILFLIFKMVYKMAKVTADTCRRLEK